jgi:uncharacterized membrane protein YdcZ (DUF606 family)
MIQSVGLASALGFFSVLQAGLNRRVADHLGLSVAALLNNAVLLATTLLVVGVLRANTAFSFRELKPVYLLPGMLGIFLVAGIPLAISRYGATRVFLPLIASQILFSLIWDRALEGIAIKPVQIVGSLVAIVGSLVASL